METLSILVITFVVLVVVYVEFLVKKINEEEVLKYQKRLNEADQRINQKYDLNWNRDARSEMIQQGFNENNPMIETLRTAPDFAVIDRDTRQVKLIEVKYQRSLSAEYTLKAASRMSQSWNPSYLFVATLDGFYMDEIANIIKNNGKIAQLNHPKINSNLQNDYLQILKKFEQDN